MNSESYPQIGSNGKQVLLVWQDTRNDQGDIFGRRLNLQGGAVDRAPFPVCIAPNAQTAPAVAAGDRDFLVVWTERSGKRIFGTWVDGVTGNVSHPQGFLVRESEIAVNQPIVASSGDSFLVVWSERTDRLSFVGALYGRHLRRNAAESDQPAFFIRGGVVGRYDVCFDAQNYLVVWTSEIPPHAGSYIFGVTIAPNQPGPTSDPVLISQGLGSHSSPSVASNGSVHWVVWQGGREGDTILSARLNTGGMFVHDREPLIIRENDSYGLRSPEVIRVGPNFLVMYQPVKTDSRSYRQNGEAAVDRTLGLQSKSGAKLALLRIRRCDSVICWGKVFRMLSLTKPDVICTHESDLDGLLAGVLLQRLAKKLFDVKVPLQAYHNHNWRQRPLTERAGWVADIAFEGRLDRAGWMVVDHHPTETLPKSALLIHDLSKSAGLLCYELCQQHGIQSPELDRLVHLSNVADLFLEDDPDFAVAYDYANLVKSYQFWNLYHLIDGEIESLLGHPLLEVMEVKRRVENPLGYRWSQANVTELSPSVGLVETVIGNINMIIHQLLETKATPYPVLVTLFRRGNGPIIASLRSRNGEALKVAEKLRGGGHPNACGASLPRSVQQIVDAVPYLRQVLNPTLRHQVQVQSLEEAFAELEEMEENRQR